MTMINDKTTVSTRTTYLCPKCDKEYYSVSRDSWEADRVGNDTKAKVAKINHKCPWELRKAKRAASKGGKR
jgi:hypothetical protein